MTLLSALGPWAGNPAYSPVYFLLSTSYSRYVYP